MLAPPVRVPAPRCSLTADKGVVPHALLHNLKHNKVLHEQNVLLTVETLNVPFAPGQADEVGPSAAISTRVVRYGFMETPDVPLALMRTCDQASRSTDGHHLFRQPRDHRRQSRRHRGMPVWRDKLFAVMHRNAAPAQASSGFPATGWWNWARRWRSDATGGRRGR